MDVVNDEGGMDLVVGDVKVAVVGRGGRRMLERERSKFHDGR